MARLLFILIEFHRKFRYIFQLLLNSSCEIEPAFAAMHGPHSLVRIGPGYADRA